MEKWSRWGLKSKVPDYSVDWLWPTELWQLYFEGSNIRLTYFFYWLTSRNIRTYVNATFIEAMFNCDSQLSLMHIFLGKRDENVPDERTQLSFAASVNCTRLSNCIGGWAQFLYFLTTNKKTSYQNISTSLFTSVLLPSCSLQLTRFTVTEEWLDSALCHVRHVV